MEEDWQADRQRLERLRRLHPAWRLQDLGDATGRSRGWVKKWLKRIREGPADDPTVLQSRSRRRKQPPPGLSQRVIDRILEIRDHPPAGLGRIPGPKAILYYLAQAATTDLAGEVIPRSTRTVWLVLKAHQRIILAPRRPHQPTDPAEPLAHWQIDFKDVTTVAPEPDGKQQHAVEVLDVIDAGTSLLVDAQPRADYTMATALTAMAQTVQANGVPATISMDRDGRFVGDTSHGDLPSPFVRFWLGLGVTVTVLPPRRPDLNAFVERYHRSYEEECVQVYRPADLDAVIAVTATYRQHYNAERPHQGRSCGNQPPLVAFPTLPPRPPAPALVDPNAWIDALDGQRFVRRVQASTAVQFDTTRYYVRQDLVGQRVTLRIEAPTRTMVIEHAGQEVKRVPIPGTGQPPCPFDQFVAQLVEEARTGRRGIPPAAHQQLPLPLPINP